MNVAQRFLRRDGWVDVMEDGFGNEGAGGQYNVEIQEEMFKSPERRITDLQSRADMMRDQVPPDIKVDFLSPDREKSIKMSDLKGRRDRNSIYRRDNNGPSQFQPSDNQANIFSPPRGLRESTFRRLERASTTQREI